MSPGIWAPAALVAAAAIAVAYSMGGKADVPAGSDPQVERAASGAARAAGNAQEVNLDALARVRPTPAQSGRNPFRFQAAPMPAPLPPAPPAGTQAPGQGGAPAPALLPPIPLKFIGIVSAPSQVGKLAVLSDGRQVFHGREGDTIEGRYRIVRIGEESIELTYLDGRGTQVIRLSGS